jgi:hypothetical protein
VWIALLIALGALVVAAAAGGALYFLAVRLRCPQLGKHERFARWSTSFQVVGVAMYAYSVANPEGMLLQIAMVPCLPVSLYCACVCVC